MHKFPSLAGRTALPLMSGGAAVFAAFVVVLLLCPGCQRPSPKPSAAALWKMHYDAAQAATDASDALVAEREARLALDAVGSLPPFDEQRALALNLLAGSYVDQFKHQEGERCYRQAIAIVRKDPSGSWVVESSILSNLAGNLAEQGRYEDARRVNAEVRAIDDAHLAPNDPERVPHLANEAYTEFVARRNAEARKLFYRVIAINKANAIRDDAQTGSYLKSIGLTYASEGNYSKAENLLKQAIPLLASSEPDSPDLARALDGLANVHNHQGRLSEAEPLYQQAITIARKRLVPEHPDLASFLGDYAILLEKTQRTREAAAMRAEAASILAKHKS